MSMFNQAFYVQLTATAQSLFGLVTSGKLWTALSFVLSHPSALWSIFGLSLAATIGIPSKKLQILILFLGQLFIYHTIKAYGALLFATVMTTRQFLSILLSCILFAHPLTPFQWVGTVVVFGTLYFKAFGKKHGHKTASSENSNDLKDPNNEARGEETLPILNTEDGYGKKQPFEGA